MTRTRAVTIVFFGVAYLATPVLARAQSGECAMAEAQRAWPVPLNREVTLDAGFDRIPLRDALEQLSRASGIRLTFAHEAVPLRRRVCVPARAMRAGDVLTTWLAGAAVPVSAGERDVVLVPGSAEQRSEGTAAPPPPLGIASLEAIRVLGLQREDGVGNPFSIVQVTPRPRGATGSVSLTQSLEGVPGIWMMPVSPGSPAAGFRSVRGASSFGASFPKIYIDGIEVASPLVFSQLSHENVERIEVIRGPQGSALYGADAIAGVIHITTRRTRSAGTETLEVRSTAGVTSSAFAPLGAFMQDHAIALRAGNTDRSVGLTATLSTLGEFIPGAATRKFLASASGSARRGSARFQFTGRLHTQRSGVATSPLLDGVGQTTFAMPGVPTYPQQAVATSGDTTAPTARRASSYTLGTTALFTGHPRVTHTVVVGVDGYALSEAAVPYVGRLALPADSLLLATAGRADRGTFRSTSVYHFSGHEQLSGTASVGVDVSVLRDQTAGAQEHWLRADPSPVWRRSAALVAQTSLTAANAVQISGGLRAERNSGYSLAPSVDVLPSLGIAYTRDVDAMSFKVRGAFGTAIRPPRVSQGWIDPRATQPNLEPERQSGVEVGIDLTHRAGVGVHLTRFDQLATGLIQPVRVPSTAGSRAPSRGAYVFQNVGVIGNSGWELQGTAAVSRLQLAGALSLVDSRVRQVASGYTGDLRSGDRMLNVPARTSSMSATWVAPSWSAGLTRSRASDWINYDWLRLIEREASDLPPVPSLYTATLRSFWLTYPGVTRWRAHASKELSRELSLVFSGDNLLGIQRGEPDNLTILPGRTISAGIKARF